METPPAAAGPHADRSWLARAEEALLALLLASVALLPLADALLRKIFGSGLPAAAPLVQHATLLVGLAGGALAAREGKLLALSPGFPKAPAPWAGLLHALRGGVGAGIALALAWASWRFVESEREAARTLVMDLPLWWVQLALPAAFVVIAGRLAWDRSRHLLWRGAAVALASSLAWLVHGVELSQSWPATAGLGLLLFSAVAGLPIFALLGGAAVFLFWAEGNPLASIALDYYRQSTNPVIPSLPLFTLAGYLLAEGGASQRLVRVFRALVGRNRAGPALVAVCASAFFTALTGASGVTILALGGLLLPFLQQSRYEEKEAIGLITGAGSLGLLFAPCLPLILYAILAEVEIRQIFAAGALPGVLLLAATAAMAFVRAPRLGTAEESARTRGDLWPALSEAKWELAVPFVALGTLFSGWATLVESAAATAAYAFVIECFVYRGLSFRRDLRRVITESGLLMGGVLLILGVALGFTNYLVDAEVPTRLLEWTMAHIQSPTLFLAALTVLLLVVGCLMDTYTALIVVVPLVLPLGRAYGIDPLHLGAIFLANLGLGFLTPPVGMNLFLASLRFDRPIGEILRSVLPYFWVQLAAVLLVTFVPPLSTLLPRALR